MVAVPMTPAAPVTTATRPSRRIRSGIQGFPLARPVVPDFHGFRARSPRDKLSEPTISFVSRADQCADRRPGRAGNRPFPAVFGVLTGGHASGGYSLYYVASPIRLLKPREMFRTIALTGFAALIAASTISLAPPARAQIGNIFSDPPLRPPGAIPRGNQPQQQPPDDDEEVPELPRGRLLPTPNRPPPGQGVPAAGQRAVAATGAAARHHRRSAEHAAGYRGRAAAAGRSGASPTRRRAPIRCRDLPPGQRQPKGVPRRAGDPAAGRRGGLRAAGARRSPTRRRASPASTRSPAASSISTRISARPCSSARCG